MFMVCEPNKTNSHVEYRVKGVYFKSEAVKFNIVRRFSQFYLLRQSLVLAFKGMYVPPLPEKLVIDNTSVETINERTFLLNKFIKHIAMSPYLVQSPEFEVFAGVDGSLEDLVKIVKRDRMKCLGLISRIEPYYFLQGIFPGQVLDSAKLQIA